MRVLNVGSGGNRELPKRYDGWQQTTLDIDAGVHPDICCSAVDLGTLPAETYDAIYCSHALEHCYLHEVPTVLLGMRHILKPTGWAEVIVPDLSKAFTQMLRCALDVTDVWYRTENGNPITFHDVLYGWQEMLKEHHLSYAHKCGFTAYSIRKQFFAAGFVGLKQGSDDFNLSNIAFKQEPACP